MFVAVLVASNTIGALPLIIAYVVKAASDLSVISAIADNPNDLSVLGLDTNLGLLLMLFPFIAGLASFVLLVKPLNNRTLTITVNGTSTFRWNRFFISGLVWMLISVIYLFICLKIDPLNFTLNNPAAVTLIILTLISLIFIPFQAAFEEVLFRGYLMQGLAVLFRNRWLPVIITSLLFGLMHAFNPEVKDFGFFTMMPQYILFGLIFGIITILDDGIEAAMGVHTANNIFLCIMVTHESSALQTSSIYEQHTIYPWSEFAALLASGILIILVLSIIFNWKNIPVLIGRI